MHVRHNQSCFLLAAVIVSTMSLVSVGCNTDASGVAASSSENAGPKKIPAFTFHKPKELSTAISRIRELHDAITGNDPLPAPIEYQVKEIVHGEGESGHSHYFLHEGEETDESAADDGDMTTGEKIHSVSVDPIEEQKDLIRWLPKIASAGDMPESQWAQVNEISKEMTPQLYAIIEGSAEQDERRASYLGNADSFSAHISTLEELVK